MPPCLIALDATLVLRGAEGAREMPIEDFFLDYRRTDLRPAEVIEAVRVPRLRARRGFSHLQGLQALRPGYFGGDRGLSPDNRRGPRDRCADRLWRAWRRRRSAPREAERALIGKAWSEAAVAAARRAIADDFEPIDDFRAGARYRAAVAANLLDRLHLQIAGGGEAPTGVFAL